MGAHSKDTHTMRPESESKTKASFVKPREATTTPAVPQKRSFVALTNCKLEDIPINNAIMEAKFHRLTNDEKRDIAFQPAQRREAQ